MKMYIAVLDQFPDFMTPTLVAHTVLRAHSQFQTDPVYQDWFQNHFRKVVVRVDKKSFDRICEIPGAVQGWENKTLGGNPSCVIPPIMETYPRVLQFADLWAPI